MIIYDDVKKNMNIAVFDLQKDILDEVANKLENDEFNVKKYNDIKKLKISIENNKIKLIILLDYNLDVIKEIRNVSKDIAIIIVSSKKIKYKEGVELNIKHIVDLDMLNHEIVYSLRLIEQEEKINFQKFKLDIVANLVESISHQIQANILLVGASLDVIKMLAEDEKISKNTERKDVLENLYAKNNISLQKANMLLQLMSDATNISSESIMQYDDIIDIIKLILDEYVKENNVSLNVSSRLRKGAYICGPLNDVIFIICKIISQLILDKTENIDLLIKEDENKWYFDITVNNSILNNDEMDNINNFILYIKDVKSKLMNNKISIEIKKIK